MIPILYEEPQFLLVNKPAGLLTQAVAGLPSLQSRLVEQLKQRDQHPGTPFVGLPPRLDRGTSGVLLIARNQRALKRLSVNSSTAEYKILSRVGRGPVVWAGRAVARFHEEGGASAAGRWWRPTAQALGRDGVCALTSDQETSLVLVRIVTGRMHQIRLQLASRGLPVVGDEMYGSTRQLGGQDLQADSRLRPGLARSAAGISPSHHAHLRRSPRRCRTTGSRWGRPRWRPSIAWSLTVTEPRPKPGNLLPPSKPPGRPNSPWAERGRLAAAGSVQRKPLPVGPVLPWQLPG